MSHMKRLLRRLIGGTIAVSCLCLGQDLKEPMTKADQGVLPVINGAVTPERIPDWIAYSLFLTTAMQHPTSRTDEPARQRAFLLASGVPAEELPAVVQLLERLQGEQGLLAAADDKASEASEPSLESAVSVAIMKLRSTVKPITFSKMASFVESEKARMKTTKFR